MSARQNINSWVLSWCLDLVGIVAALVLGGWLRQSLALGKAEPGIAAAIVPIVVFAVVAWTIASFTLSLYHERRNYSALIQYQNVLVASTVSLLLLAGALFFSYREVSRLFVLYYFFFQVLLLAGWRSIGLLLTPHEVRQRQPRRVAIIGSDGEGISIADKLNEREGEFLFLGFLTVNGTTVVNGQKIIGSFDNTYDIVKKHAIEEVIVVATSHSRRDLQQLVFTLQPLNVDFRLASQYGDLAPYRTREDDFGGAPFGNLSHSTLGNYQRFVKRVFDIVVAFILLIFAIPLMTLIALAIRYDSAGAIIYKQKRVGENGRLFTMYKFRSMVAAETLAQDEPATNGDHKIRNDKRVTKIGRILRRMSLDELPQLFNVLRGDMSLVGPRPEVPWLVREYHSWQYKRFAVPQGMTGWWQVNGRSDKPMHQHTEYDLYYIENASIFFDLYILLRTVAIVINGRGAY